MTQRLWTRPTLFMGPLWLYLLSAGVGVWSAQGLPRAWLSLAMIAASLVLYELLVRIPAQLSLGDRLKVAPLSIFFGLLPTAIGLYFLLTGSWVYGLTKLPWLNAATHRLSAYSFRFGYPLDSNVAGGLIAALLPLQVWALWPRRRETRYRVVGGLAVFISAVGLVLSASRGAWLALAVMLAGWGLWQLSERWARPWGGGWRRVALWLCLMTVVGVAGLGFMFSPWGLSLRAFVEGDRAETWRNSLDLATDYPFTGLGIGRFQMAYSSYTVLLHVGYAEHAHNLFLNVWLEQGLPGLIAIGWLVALAVWPGATPSAWRGAALASLAVLLLHGMVDDIFYGFGARSVVLVLPLALLARTDSTPGQAPTQSDPGRAALYSGAAVAGVFAVLAVVTAVVPPVRAAFLANLGAVAQSRVELSIYRWPEWAVQDEVRRALWPDLLPAREFYQAALAVDSKNAAANRRLGQIEISDGDYAAACVHIQQAFASAPEQRATVQLMGECDAITGDLVDAARLWRTIDISQGQITLRQFWYEFTGDSERSDSLRQAAALAQP